MGISIPEPTLHTTEAYSYLCTPCNIRLTVINGPLDKCPDCGSWLRHGGRAQVVEIVK